MNEDRQTARTVVNHVADARGLPVPWPESAAPLPDELTGVDLSAWGVVEFGEMRQRLLSGRDRERFGVIYTPPEIAAWQVRSALDPQLERLVDVAYPLAHLTIHDPFCGPGIFLIETARHIAAWCLSRVNVHATPERVRWVTGETLTRCIFGNDIDEVAIDLARAACWLEVGGTRPITFMDRNIVVGDTFNNELPPALAERWPASPNDAVRTAPVVTGQADLFEEAS